MIKTFRHKGLRAFFETGSRSGIQPHHATRLKRQLVRLDLAKSADDMNVPGWTMHPLSTGHWSVWRKYAQKAAHSEYAEHDGGKPEQYEHLDHSLGQPGKELAGKKLVRT